MKKHIYTIMMGTLGLFALSGCDSNVVATDEGQQPILFSAGLPEAQTSAAGTRAVNTPFMDNQIAIVAANAEIGTPTSPATDWSSLYLNHEIGNVGAKTYVNGYDEYPITLANAPKYWPFNPDKYLSFVAYSPIAGKSNISQTNMTLTVAHGTDGTFFPDLLYTGTVGNYNKTNKAVRLDFQHAMAKVVVKVMALDKDGNEITDKNAHPLKNLQITSLVLNTKATTGTFGLVSSQWTLTDPGIGASSVAYTLASTGNTGSVPYDSSSTSVCYLLPATSAVNTVALSSLTIKLKENGITGEVGGEFPLSSFKQIDGKPVTLEMGKTTVLLVKLQYSDIPTDNGTIQLMGQLVEWDYKGTSTVVIE